MIGKTNLEISHKDTAPIKIAKTNLRKFYPSLTDGVPLYALNDVVFSSSPVVDFLKTIDQFTPNEAEKKQSELNKDILLEQISYMYPDGKLMPPWEVKEKIEKLLDHLDKNHAIVGSPFDANERERFFGRLKKGFYFALDIIKKQHDNNEMDDFQTYACLEMIAQGADHCAGRWRKVLDELMTGLNRTNEDEKVLGRNHVISEKLREIFYDARQVVLNQFTDEFIENYLPDVDDGLRIHYESFFQRRLNELKNLNLPISTDADPLLRSDSEFITEAIEDFLRDKNFDEIILEKVTDKLSEKVEKDDEFYMAIIDWSNAYYANKKLNTMIEDQVAFLSNFVFKGFSKELRPASMYVLLEDIDSIRIANESPMKIESFFNMTTDRSYQKKIISFLKCYEHELANPSGDKSIFEQMVHIDGGKTPLLTFCISSGEKKLAMKLIRAGVNVNQVDESIYPRWKQTTQGAVKGRTPLHQAIHMGDMEIAKCLIEHGAKIFEGNLMLDSYFGYTPLDIAVMEHKNDFVQLFTQIAVKDNVNTMVQTGLGQTPILSYLIMHELNNEVEVLLKAGADVRKADMMPFHDGEGQHPLHIAVKKGDAEMVQLLLNYGADPFHDKVYICSKKEQTPFDIALNSFDENILKQLLSHSIQKNIQTLTDEMNHERPILTYLIENEHTDLARFMIDEGANVHICDNNARHSWLSSNPVYVTDVTPMAFAIKNGSIDLVQKLLDKNAHPFDPVLNTIGDTSIHAVNIITEEYKELSTKQRDIMLNLFLDKIEEIPHLPVDFLKSKIKYPDGHIPMLTYVVEKGFNKLAKTMILQGADPNCTDVSSFRGWANGWSKPIRGKTPLHVAVRTQNTEMVNFLLQHGADPSAGIWTMPIRTMLPMEIAQAHKFKAIERLLEQKIYWNQNSMEKNKCIEKQRSFIL